MTAARFSLMFSGCFVTLFIWVGCTTVVCLVEKTMAAQPTTTIGYLSTQKTPTDPTHGKVSPAFACGNTSHSCMDYCQLCHEFFSAPNTLCLSTLFNHLCLSKFEQAMDLLNTTDWCTWSKVSSFYSNLSYCTEEISDCVLVPWPNPLVERTFVDIHTKYFKDCPSEELSDPAPAIIFALVITPICLIPVMVSLVVLKTKNGDGSS